MTIRRTWLVPAILVILGSADLSWGQFQQQLIQPVQPRRSGRGRGRLGAATPARLHLAASCLDYGVKTPEPTDVFASVNRGYGFLIGGLPDGSTQRLDLSDAIGTGQAVLRGTGKADEVLLEVRTPGWSDVDIRPGLQAIPPGRTEMEVPKTTLALAKQAAALEDDLEKLPADAGPVLDRILAEARQEHVWAIRSGSWQALNAGADPLQAALDRVALLRDDPTAAARTDWLLWRQPTAPRREPDLSFLNDFVVLRLSGPAQRNPSSLELCTKDGLVRAPLTRAGLGSLEEPLSHGLLGYVLVTNELLGKLDRAGLTPVLDAALVAAGHIAAWRLPDDDLLVQSFEAGPAVRRRFVVAAPQNAAEAKALFGRGSRAAFAFKDLIDEKLVGHVRTAADLRQLAAKIKSDQSLVFVCVRECGRTLLPDGSELQTADLPPGVAEVIAVDGLDPAEKPPVEAVAGGGFTFDALAAGVRSAATAGQAAALTRPELLASLGAGLQAHWKQQRLVAGPVLKWARTIHGDALGVGAGGTVLKINAMRPRKEEQGKPAS